MSVWSGEKVSKFITTPPEIKISPNSVDIRASEIFLIPFETEAIFHGKIRESKKVKIEPDEQGFYNLENGTYEVRIANEIEIPKNAIGFLLPRSSMNRLGMIKSETAVWDSGYKGFGTQTVFIPIKKFKIHKDEPWFQVVIMDSESSGTYDGHWQNEKPKD